MKGFATFLLLGTLVLFSLDKSAAQVTNLNINRSGTSFTMTSGDTIRWDFDLPPGSTAQGMLWYDSNNNGVIDTASDLLVFAFTQTDGNASGQTQGPPDLDGSANGHIEFYQRVGLPAGKYLFRFTQNGTGMTASGTMNALPSPAHTVSGHVTPPSGRSPKTVMMQMERKGGGEPIFWIGMTDASGNYSIPMSADTAGNPWRLRPVYNAYPPALLTPQQLNVTVSGNPSGEDFTYQAAAAQVAGFLRDEDGSPMLETDVSLMSQNGMLFRSARTNQYGYFQVGLLSTDLTGGSWNLQTNMQADTTGQDLEAAVQIPIINAADSLVHNLTIYHGNATIQGQVRINGGAPSMNMFLMANSLDTARATSHVDPATGNFTLYVSSKLRNYYLVPQQLGPNYFLPTVIAHPGDTGVILNLTTTGIDQIGASVPSAFSLGQNYPNPFNPTTNIEFEISKATNVRLTVFNLLGQEVTTLVNGDLGAGRYKTTFDGSKLTSGVYFYRLVAGSFTATKKMILAK